MTGTDWPSPGANLSLLEQQIKEILAATGVDVPSLAVVRDIARSESPKGDAKKLNRIKHGIAHGQVSLARSMARVKHAALLGASLDWISSGPKLVQSFMKETLPSWLFAANMLELDGEDSGAVVAMLRGYALAYFVMPCGAFTWGIDQYSPILSKRRQQILEMHLEFLAGVVERKIQLHCHCTTWRAYVSGFLSLIMSCSPLWIQEIDVGTMKRLSKGLRWLNEYELVLRLLESGGIGAIGAAAEMIIALEHRF